MHQTIPPDPCILDKNTLEYPSLYSVYVSNNSSKQYLLIPVSWIKYLRISIAVSVSNNPSCIPVSSILVENSGGNPIKLSRNDK